MRRTSEVTEITERHRQLIPDMIETMYAAPGVGLAANQVGVSECFAVIDTRPKKKSGTVIEEELTECEKKLNFPLVLFNPEILESRGDVPFEEGCLSVPGYVEQVQRKDWVRVRAMNEKGETFEFEADGLLAICVQHEIDHLNGQLYLDRLTPIRRNMLKNKIKKHGYPEKDKGKHSQL